MIRARGSPPPPHRHTRGILDDLGSGNGKITVIPHVPVLPFSEMHGIILPISEPKSSKMVIPPRAVERGGDVWESFCHFQSLKPPKWAGARGNHHFAIFRAQILQNGDSPACGGGEGGGGMIELHVSSLHFCPDANLVGMRTDAKLLGMRTPLHTSTYC